MRIWNITSSYRREHRGPWWRHGLLLLLSNHSGISPQTHLPQTAPPPTTCLEGLSTWASSSSPDAGYARGQAEPRVAEARRQRADKTSWSPCTRVGMLGSPELHLSRLLLQPCLLVWATSHPSLRTLCLRKQSWFLLLATPPVELKNTWAACPGHSESWEQAPG